MSGQLWGYGIALVPSHGLGSKCHNAVVRAPTAGLTGLCTPWDVCMMKRGRMVVVVSLKTSVIRSYHISSGDMASLSPPSHGLGSKCHNAVVRAPTAGLTGLYKARHGTCA